MHASRHRVVCETRTPPGHRCSTLPRLCTPEGSRSARVAVSSPVSGWTCTQETVSERVARARQRSNLAWQWNWEEVRTPHSTALVCTSGGDEDLTAAEPFYTLAA